MTTYSINLIDSDRAPTWLRLCDSFVPGAQDSGYFRATVTTQDAPALEAALEADDDVVEYASIG